MPFDWSSCPLCQSSQSCSPILSMGNPTDSIASNYKPRSQGKLKATTFIPSSFLRMIYLNLSHHEVSVCPFIRSLEDDYASVFSLQRMLTLSASEISLNWDKLSNKTHAKFSGKTPKTKLKILFIHIATEGF